MPSTWRTLVLARLGPTTGAPAVGPASAAYVDIDLVSGTTSGGLADSGGIFTTAFAGGPVMTAGRPRLRRRPGRRRRRALVLRPPSAPLG